jgi:hypothetical protein
LQEAVDLGKIHNRALLVTIDLPGLRARAAVCGIASVEADRFGEVGDGAVQGLEDFHRVRRRRRVMRAFAEQTYGIPPEQVVGSSGVTQFQTGADGKPVLIKEPKVEFVEALGKRS